MSSSLPPNTQRLIYGGGDWSLPGEDESHCEGAQFHSPRPLFTKHTMLVRRNWWPDDEAPDAPKHAYWVMAPKASLCGTCRDNLDILLQIIFQAGGPSEVDWAVRREFGNDLRALAIRGWEWYAEHHLPEPEPEQATAGAEV